MRKLLKFAAFVLLLLFLALAGIYLFAPARVVDAEYARLAWQSGLQSRSVTAAEHRISYYEGGYGEPVLLLHGFSGSKENWLQMAGLLTPKYKLIIPDLPGWAASERKADADYDMRAQVERIVALLDALKLTRVHLVGHSMGGHIAGLFAAAHPDRVLDVVLVAPAGLHFKENDFVRRIFAGETPFNVDNVEQLNALFAVLFEKPPYLPNGLKQVLVDRNIVNHQFHANLIGILKRGPNAFLLEEQLPQLPPLVSIVWCDRDRVLDVSSLDVVKARRPDIQSTVLTGCGHMPMMEQPAAAAAAIEKGFVLH